MPEKLEDLQNHRILIVANAEYARSNWLRQFEKDHNFTLSSIERKLAVNDIDLVYEACLAGMGITALPDLTLPNGIYRAVNWYSCSRRSRFRYAPSRWCFRRTVIWPTKAAPSSTLLPPISKKNRPDYSGLIILTLLRPRFAPANAGHSVRRKSSAPGQFCARRSRRTQCRFWPAPPACYPGLRFPPGR